MWRSCGLKRSWQYCTKATIPMQKVSLITGHAGMPQKKIHIRAITLPVVVAVTEPMLFYRLSLITGHLHAGMPQKKMRISFRFLASSCSLRSAKPAAKIKPPSGRMVPALRPFRVSICCHPRARLMGNFQRSWHESTCLRLVVPGSFLLRHASKLRPFSGLITISRWGDRFGEFAAHEEAKKNRIQTGEHESKPVGDSEYFCRVLFLVVFRWLCFLYGFAWCDSGSVFKFGDFFVSAVPKKTCPRNVFKRCVTESWSRIVFKKRVQHTCLRNMF